MSKIKQASFQHLSHVSSWPWCSLPPTHLGWGVLCQDGVHSSQKCSFFHVAKPQVFSCLILRGAFYKLSNPTLQLSSPGCRWREWNSSWLHSPRRVSPIAYWHAEFPVGEWDEVLNYLCHIKLMRVLETVEYICL